MGLFDNKSKKKRDEFESPVEQIDLSSASALAPPPRDDDDHDDRPAAAAKPAASPAPGPAASAPPERPRQRRQSSGYGIDDAIALMRTLPSENVELVVQVVKHTLESTRIDIAAIIEDASEKQARLEARTKVLKDEITELENEIAARKKEIDGHDADHRETTMVKERLVLAEKLTKKADAKADAKPEPARSEASASTAAPRAARPTGDLPRASHTSTPPPIGTATPATGVARSTSHTVLKK